MDSVPDGTFGMPVETLRNLTPYSQSIVVRLLNHKPEAFNLCVIPLILSKARLELTHTLDHGIQPRSLRLSLSCCTRRTTTFKFYLRPVLSRCDLIQVKQHYLAVNPMKLTRT